MPHAPRAEEAPEPFSVAIAEEDIEDLRTRLKRTRWADDYGNSAWDYGVPGAALRPLVDYWIEGFDWRQQEREINALDQFRIVLDDVPVHFVWLRNQRSRGFPIILSHGWPWTFWDFHRLLRSLAAVEVDGIAPSFDLVVPSLPGYGFSSPLRRTGIGAAETADLWVRLMTTLGYESFGAVGGDGGAHVTANLAHAHADRVRGAYLTTCALPGFDSRGLRPADFADDEQAAFARSQTQMRSARAHVLLNRDGPQTSAWALNDSPAGLAALLLEKRRAWGGRDRPFEDVFPRDFILTTSCIYWFTQTVHTAARFYAESLRSPWRSRHERRPLLQAPVGVGLFPDEPFLLPRAVMADHANLVHWKHFGRGGHFAPFEEPDVLAEDIARFFGALGCVGAVPPA